MASEIRSLLEADQRAEAQGDRPRAVARLQEAAEFYRSRRMERRAAQMERHIDRLEGRAVHLDHFWEDDDAVAHVLEDTPFETSAPSDDGLGFGDELLPTGKRARRMESSIFDRGPQPADPAIDAWCSFCCKPKAEVGALIAGPAGAFICASCLSTSANLLALPPDRACAYRSW